MINDYLKYIGEWFESHSLSHKEKPLTFEEWEQGREVQRHGQTEDTDR